MDDILIPCPKCGKELRLRDPKLLGKTGKCPKCSHRFKLEEPEDEVELELADTHAVPVGTSAQWVPDEQPAAAPAATTAPVVAAGMPEFATADAASPSMARLRSARNKKPDKVKIAVIVGSIVSAIAVVVVLIVAATSSPNRPQADNENTAAVSDDGDPLATPGDNAVGEQDPQAPIPGDKPPSGKPIALNYIPGGTRLIIHLRPAEIWKAGSDAETVRFCLGSLGTWTEKKLTDLLLFKPSEIEEATICLFIDDVNAPPEVAFRVTLTEKKLKSDLFERFGGRTNSEFGRPIYVTDGNDEHPATAYMITDQIGREFAAAPKSRAKEMIDAERNPGYAAGGLDQLLKQTDDRRHLTVVFDPADLRKSKAFLFPESMADLLGHFLVRFDDSLMDTVAWSFHFGDSKYDKFFSEIILRNKTAISSPLLKDNVDVWLGNLAEELLGAVRRMTPKLVAERKLVGRLPAMYKAYYVQTQSTSAGPGERWVRLTTVLPKVAGPNLAAGSLFAWRMAQTTDFSKPAPKPSSTKIPELIADRLKLPVDVDFRRRPFQEAIQFISEETHIPIEIDGDALKDSGYTKNMPQNMKLGEVSGVVVLSAILKQYPAMVISVDEQKKLLTVTTKKFAAKKGLPPYELIK